jgi:hypothetical protein
MQELVRLSGSHDPPKLCQDCSRGPSTRRQGTVNSPCRANSPIGSLEPRLQHLRHEHEANQFRDRLSANFGLCVSPPQQPLLLLNAF